MSASRAADIVVEGSACRQRRDRKACHESAADEVASDHSSDSEPGDVVVNLSVLDASDLHSMQNNDSLLHVP